MMRISVYLETAMNKYRTTLPFLLMNIALCGCASPFDDVSVKRGFFAAVGSPDVLIPAIGALVFQIDNWDEDTSDWARENTPLYGSTDTARDVSNVLITSVVGAELVDMAVGLAESDDDVLGQALGPVVTAGTITGLKEITGRERPNGEDDKSFPSGHAGNTAAATMFLRQRLKRHQLNKTSHAITTGTLTAIPYATGWARVEAGKHFPSDVLAGIAIGNFSSIIFYEVFDSNDEEWTLSVRPENAGVMIGFRKSF